MCEILKVGGKICKNMKDEWKKVQISQLIISVQVFERVGFPRLDTEESTMQAHSWVQLM